MFFNETLSLIRYCLSKDEVPAITDWNTVIKEFRENAIIPLLSSCKSSIKIPEPYATAIKNTVYMNVSHMTKAGREQQAITDALSEYEIAPVVLKGFSLAQYYEIPAMRTYGDVDILLYDEESFNIAVKELLNLGYSPMKEYEDLSYQGSMSNISRHFEFKKNNIEVELHSRYAGKETELDDYLKQIMPIQESVLDFNFWCFPDLMNGLILLQHIKYHLDSGGVGLRMLIDWFNYAKAVLSDQYWNDCFKKESEELGLKKLAICMTKICQEYLGLGERCFTEGFDENICVDFMNFVSLSGNFGIAETKMSKTVNSLSKNKNLFTVLQNRGEINCSLFDKCTLLLPFAWVYGLFISIKDVLSTPNWIKEAYAGKTQFKLNKKIKSNLGLL